MELLTIALANRMKEMGLTPLELAEKIGVSRQEIYRIQKGKNAIGVDRLDELAKALDVTPAQLLKGQDDAQEPLTTCISRVASAALASQNSAPQESSRIAPYVGVPQPVETGGPSESAEGPLLGDFLAALAIALKSPKMRRAIRDLLEIAEAKAPEEQAG